MNATERAREQAHLSGEITITSRQFELLEMHVKCIQIDNVPSSPKLVLHRLKTLLTAINVAAEFETSGQSRQELLAPWFKNKLALYSEPCKLRGQKSASPEQIEEQKSQRDKLYESGAQHFNSLFDDRKWQYWDARIINDETISLVINEIEPVSSYADLSWLLQLCGATEVKVAKKITNHDLLCEEQKSELERRARNSEPDFDYVTEESAFNESKSETANKGLTLIFIAIIAGLCAYGLSMVF